MPILEITDATGELTQLAPVIVAAAMFSSTDESHHVEIVATGYVDAALQIRQSIPPEIAEVTHHGRSKEVIERHAGRQGYDGWIAGQILLFVLRCAAHRPEDASVRKAVYIMERALMHEERLQKPLFPSSTTRIWDAWSKYKSVCHLWAALHILGKGEDALKIENLSELLGTAEFLRGIGERHYPPGKPDKSLPLLDPDETWRAPHNLNLAEMAFEAPDLYPHELEWLAEYRVQEQLRD